MTRMIPKDDRPTDEADHLTDTERSARRLMWARIGRDGTSARRFGAYARNRALYVRRLCVSFTLGSGTRQPNACETYCRPQAFRTTYCRRFKALSTPARLAGSGRVDRTNQWRRSRSRHALMRAFNSTCCFLTTAPWCISLISVSDGLRACLWRVVTHDTSCPPSSTFGCGFMANRSTLCLTRRERFSVTRAAIGPTSGRSSCGANPRVRTLTSLSAGTSCCDSSTTGYGRRLRQRDFQSLRCSCWTSLYWHAIVCCQCTGPRLTRLYLDVCLLC